MTTLPEMCSECGRPKPSEDERQEGKDLRAMVRTLRTEVKTLHEQVAFLESKEVCTMPHDDIVIEGCPWCKIEKLTRRLP